MHLCSVLVQDRTKQRAKKRQQGSLEQRQPRDIVCTNLKWQMGPTLPSALWPFLSSRTCRPPKRHTNLVGTKKDICSLAGRRNQRSRLATEAEPARTLGSSVRGPNRRRQARSSSLARDKLPCLMSHAHDRPKIWRSGALYEDADPSPDLDIHPVITSSRHPLRMMQQSRSACTVGVRL